MRGHRNIVMTVTLTVVAVVAVVAVGCSQQNVRPKAELAVVTEAADAAPTTAKWRPRSGRGNEVISVLSAAEVCGLLTLEEVERAFAVRLDASKTTYERAIFSNGRFSGCTYVVEAGEKGSSNPTSGSISWKVQSWPFEVERLTDPSVNGKGNGEFPKAIAQTIGGKSAALQDFSMQVGEADESAYEGMLLTVDFDSYSVLLSADQFEGDNDRVAFRSLSELLVKRVGVLTPASESERPATAVTTTTGIPMSAYDRSDRQLCDLIRDESVRRWNSLSKVSMSGQLECDIDLRTGPDSSIRTTKNEAEYQVGRRVGYQDVAGEIVPMGERQAHLVVAGNESFPELVAWVVLSDDLSVMFRVFGLTDTEANRRSVVAELAHIVDELAG